MARIRCSISSRWIDHGGRRCHCEKVRIFPASATLIEKHEKQKKEKEGLQAIQRAREAASVDAAGSAMGSMGLFVFALLVWQFVPRHSALPVLTGATIAWLAVSVLFWLVRKRA